MIHNLPNAGLKKKVVVFSSIQFLRSVNLRKKANTKISQIWPQDIIASSQGNYCGQMVHCLRLNCPRRWSQDKDKQFERWFQNAPVEDRVGWGREWSQWKVNYQARFPPGKLGLILLVNSRKLCMSYLRVRPTVGLGLFISNWLKTTSGGY